ncbi:MAG: peptidase [Gammaproteobacteria bacterium]|nr:peptidase [Gammaproteobacteria bacterium]
MTAFALLVAPFLGFYDGFFGPGTGSFMALALVMLLGYGLPKATAHAKILNFVSNLSSLLYFILYGEIYWQVGMVMIVGQVIGATIGAKMILDKGSAMIKPIVVTVCFVMSVNILWQYF